MNKKGNLLIGVGIWFLLGIGLYLAYSSIESWMFDTLKIDKSVSFFIGILIVCVIIFFLRNKLPKF